MISKNNFYFSSETLNKSLDSAEKGKRRGPAMRCQFLRQSIGLSAFSLALVLSACANPGREQKAQEQESADDSARPVTADLSRASSRIVLKFRETERLQQIKGGLVGIAGGPSLTPLVEQPGRYMIGPLKGGSYDILLEAQKLSDQPGQDNYGVAIRISGITVQNDQDTFLADVELRPYLHIKGAVKLSGAAPQAGVEISIPQTGIKTTTAANGSFDFDRVPSGHHTFEVRTSGYTTGVFEKRQFTADSTLPTITLVPQDQNLAIGAHYLGAPLPQLQSFVVTIHLQRPQLMNQVRWGSTADLSSAAWQPYQSSVEVELAADQRLVYVQYAQDGKQLSAVYPVTIPQE